MSRPLSGEDVQGYWIDEIKRAERCKEEWKRDFRVDDCYRAFLGDQLPGNNGWNSYAPEDWFTLNLIFANVHAQIPSLYFQNPYFSMHLKRSYHPDPKLIQSYEQDMRVRESVLNYLVGENDLVSKGQLCILDAYFQFGVLEARYIPQYERNPNAGNSKKSKDGVILKDSEGNEIIEEEDILVGERFRWERVNPNNILVNADASCEDFAWIAQRITDYITNVRNNPNFKNTDKKNLKPDNSIDNFDPEASDNSDGFMAKLGGRRRKRDIEKEPENSQLVTYWKIHDIARRKIWIIAKNGTKPLLEKNTPEGIEGHPYAFLKFNDNPNFTGKESWYPVPEIFNQLGPQREYNMACNDVAIHRKRYKRKYGSYHGVIDEEEAMKFEAPEDGVVVTFNHPDWPAKFQPIQDAQLDSAVTFDRIQLRTDFADIAGSGPDSAIGGKSDTATEASIVSNRLQIRESDKQFRIKRFLLDCAIKMHKLLQYGLTRDGAVKVTGPEGERWVEYSPNNFGEIAGEFKFDLDVFSMSPRDPMIERAQWMQFMQTILQAPMVFNDPTVLKKWAEKFDIRDDSMLESLAQKLVQMTQMAQANQGLLPNMPQGNAAPTSIGNVLSALGGGR